MQSKLLFKPADHPIAALHHHLYIECIGDNTRVGGVKRNGFEVLVAGNIKGCSSAVAKAAGLVIEAAGAQYFAGFVGTAGD